MNKSDLITAVSAHLGDRQDAEIAVDAVFSEIMKALIDGDEVTISRFARFYTVSRPRRTRRNPATGLPVTVEPSSTIHFKASQTLRDLVSGRTVHDDPDRPLILKRGPGSRQGHKEALEAAPENEEGLYACPQCGATTAEEDGRLIRYEEGADHVTWQCHNPECQWFAVEGEDEGPNPVKRTR